MGIQSLNNRGGSSIDVTKLLPLIGSGSNITGTGAFQTVLSLNGKGYIETFILNGAGTLSIIRMTIDGVVTMLLQSTTANSVIGLASKSDLRTVGNSASALAIISATSNNNHTGASGIIKGYPMTDSSQSVIIPPTPIYFKSSVLLEVQGSSPSTYGYRYDGGYM